MQLSGSLSQLILHRNLSQAIQPIGGVNAKPLSSEKTWLTPSTAISASTATAIDFILQNKLVSTVKLKVIEPKWQLKQN